MNIKAMTANNATGMLRMPTAMPIAHIESTAAMEKNTKTHFMSFNETPPSIQKNFFS